MLRSLGALVIATSLYGMPLAASAQDWGRPQGYEQRQTSIGVVNYIGGRFVYEGRGRWTEYGSGSIVKARFDELSRSGDWIDLNDPTRDVQIRLNLRDRVILITERGGPYRRLYGIASIENDRRGGGGGFGGRDWNRGRDWDRDRDWGREDYDEPAGYGRAPNGRPPSGGGPRVEEIEAGQWFVTQFDADRVCPSVASRQGGTWTGKWRTTRPTVMSVCEIRYGR